MGIVIPLVTQPIHTERTTLAHLDVESVPDAAVQLRAAVDLDIHVGPAEQLLLALTHQQADHLVQDLGARLGYRLIGIRR
ncbi:hypothetical protein C7C46_20950 [Streptomyces tateyamensis]|uniref:Uncharacterized protein n=1 Tax=Streptomyces tateyamensis TaxID=565073 RepID=A0A2V4NCJ8_9ACTN|nr:hypothetical protein [Streptomyces tateyamensis]PYC76865.1 hypothetical protein C7C46_20950 [Streptomyces tateyamensis]